MMMHGFANVRKDNLLVFGKYLCYNERNYLDEVEIKGK